ncbi:hypothetical protein [Cupriavidus sp. CuC1]|uniref:hypothetical protein n=1 Tax=Cupriavidus sp. CuC1 TaxID=3373131 RepID=UPI0037D2001A
MTTMPTRVEMLIEDVRSATEKYPYSSVHYLAGYIGGALDPDRKMTPEQGEELAAALEAWAIAFAAHKAKLGR